MHQHQRQYWETESAKCRNAMIDPSTNQHATCGSPDSSHGFPAGSWVWVLGSGPVSVQDAQNRFMVALRTSESEIARTIHTHARAARPVCRRGGLQASPSYKRLFKCNRHLYDWHTHHALSYYCETYLYWSFFAATVGSPEAEENQHHFNHHSSLLSSSYSP